VLQADTILNTVKEHVNPLTELTTDDATSYSKLDKHVKSHHAQVIKKEDLPKILPWVHIAISNVKRLLLDVHHQLSNDYLQYYLNEFCYTKLFSNIKNNSYLCSEKTNNIYYEQNSKD